MISSDSKNFLYKLLTTPSPTGFEEQIQKVVRDHMKTYADTIETDLHGNVIVGINTKASRKVMLAGHCDQIGFMVKHITKDGFVFVTALGGIDVAVLPGSRVTVNGKGGKLDGIIGRKPIHLQTGDEKNAFKLDIEKVWLDFGFKTQKEAEKIIEVGDSVTFKPEVMELGKDFICGPGLDDRVGLFVAMETLKLCSKAKLDVALYAVSTVQEEVGLRGARTSAFGIDPEVGIAIDVTHASDNPANDNSKAVPVKLGFGPCVAKGPSVNPVVARTLMEVAKKSKIPYQPEPSSKLIGNDATAIQTARGGTATASIGIPNRYMHSQVEMCSLSDLENASKLLAAFTKSINKKTDFRPMAS